MLGLVTMWILLVLMSWYRDGSYILDLVKVFTKLKSLALVESKLVIICLEN